MAYTGYLIIRYIDDNPDSPTYGQTWEERTLNQSHCPQGDGNWVLVSTECQMVTSGYTGYKISTYYNDFLQEYSSTTTPDSSCQSSASTWGDEEIWVNSGDPFCEIDDNGIYTGRGIQIQQQKNFNLANYGQTREIEVTLTECSGYTQPQWEEISHQCHVVKDELTCYLKFDGTADILQIDANPSSPTFNQTRTIQAESEDCYCEACESIVSEWRYVAESCGNAMPSEYHLSGLTDDTIYKVYRRYDTCVNGGQSGKTTPTNIYSAETYQTGVEECVYRWVETESTVCVEENLKFKATYSNGTSYSAECDSDTILSEEEVRPSGYEYSSMTSAEIGNCITSIDEYAFNECSSLASIAIPNSVTSIGGSAFESCYGLTEINIPDSVTSINDWTFGNCYALASVTIGTGVTSIGQQSFYRCSGLTEVTIPDSVTSIGLAAFRDCTSLTSITINAITPPAISSNALTNTNDCPIYVPCDSIDAYKSAPVWNNYSSRIQGIGCFNGKFKATYSDGRTYSAECDSSTDLTSATTKPYGYQYTAMTTAEIGDCVTSIGKNNTTNLYAPFYKCTSLTSITIPDSVTSIGNFAFADCSGLTSVTIGTGVTSIETDAFIGRSDLISMVVDAGNTVYDSRNNCNAIIETSTNKLIVGCKNTVIPNTVTMIGFFAFAYCSGLTGITIHDSVTSIGYTAFIGCSDLISMVVDAGNTVYDSRNNCNAIIETSTNKLIAGCKNTVIPNTVTMIGDNAFDDCSGLTGITIPDSVTSIGYAAFGLCLGLTGITIPDSVTSIGIAAFQYCRSLTSITINAITPPTLGSGVFDNTNNCPIYVPCNSLNAYKTASGWSEYADRIREIP